MLAVLERPIDAKAMAIFGILITLLAPPLAFYVFSMLDYRFGFKILIWLAFVVFCFCLVKSFTFVGFLNRLGNIHPKRVVS